ncbi:hypothetical protein C882_2592 [Caenispirillum salinarum AK4]|uniref:Uncharacterized protein n=1 Tax=Caenispirillum salinarum AK4 TaxID=1238182 RepID=K9HQF4_9PROT|nr:hypothetical protein C882_2592 [Caenispirillum salinarum AK4]
MSRHSASPRGHCGNIRREHNAPSPCTARFLGCMLEFFRLFLD